MTVHEHVLSVLRCRLLSGHYDPGTRLREEAIAKDLGVSRTPVRGAIHRLVAEGLLTVKPNRGAVVREWTSADREEIFQIRILVESHAVSRAARTVGAETIDAMDVMNERIAQAITDGSEGFRDIAHDANMAFHTAIYDNCGSNHMAQLGRTLLDYPLVVSGFYLYSEGEMWQSVRQHREILCALSAGSEGWARSAMETHLHAAVIRFRRSLNE